MGKQNLFDLTGEVYGLLTVIEEADPRDYHGKKIRMWLCLCECGSKTVVHQYDLRSGHTKSCGCYRVEASKTHGDATHSEFKYLYGQYRELKKRCKQRTANGDLCRDLFGSYPVFKDWAIVNGWRRGMVVCRNNDVGDYSPENARIDTFSNNVIEANARHHAFIDPEGNVVKIYNLSKYCRDNGLHASSMVRVEKGKQGHHKGWRKYNG